MRNAWLRLLQPDEVGWLLCVSPPLTLWLIYRIMRCFDAFISWSWRGRRIAKWFLSQQLNEDRSLSPLSSTDDRLRFCPIWLPHDRQRNINEFAWEIAFAREMCEKIPFVIFSILHRFRIPQRRPKCHSIGEWEKNNRTGSQINKTRKHFRWATRGVIRAEPFYCYFSRSTFLWPIIVRGCFSRCAPWGCKSAFLYQNKNVFSVVQSEWDWKVIKGLAGAIAHAAQLFRCRRAHPRH